MNMADSNGNPPSPELILDLYKLRKQSQERRQRLIERAIRRIGPSEQGLGALLPAIAGFLAAFFQFDRSLSWIFMTVAVLIIISLRLGALDRRIDAIVKLLDLDDPSKKFEQESPKGD